MRFSVKKEWFANADCVEIIRIFKQGAKITETPPPRPAKIFGFPKSFTQNASNRVSTPEESGNAFAKWAAYLPFFDAAGNGLNRRRQRVAVAGCVASKFRRPSKGEGGDREEASDGEGSDRKARAIAS